MYYLNLLFFLFFIYIIKNIYTTNFDVVDLENITKDSEKVDPKWILHNIKTNPFSNVKHPKYKGDFIRAIDELYVYETEDYNNYKIERYNNNIDNIYNSNGTYNQNENGELRDGKFNCAITFLIHGKPSMFDVNYIKLWSGVANLIKHEVMNKKKYGKYIIYAPFVTIKTFKKKGDFSHVDYAYILALRISMVLKKLISDKTCYNYDVMFYGNCLGANVTRILFNLNSNIWGYNKYNLNINWIEERKKLIILNRNFNVTLKNIEIIPLNKKKIRPYTIDSLRRKNYLFGNVNINLSNYNYENTFDNLFDDYHLDYEYLNINMLKNLNIYYSSNEEKYKIPVNKVIKRFHYYMLNKKITLVNVTFTGIPVSGLVTEMSDRRIGFQKLFKYKKFIAYLPKFIKTYIIHFKDVEESFIMDEQKLLCVVSIDEKVDYDYVKNRGSLLSFFKTVNYYSDLDNDDIVDSYSGLGLYSDIFMRSLSFYLLNFRNEFFNRVSKMPVHLSPINVTNNDSFLYYIKTHNVCKYVKSKHMDFFVSYVNELINYEQKPKPLIPMRYTYKNPVLKHYEKSFFSSSYTNHFILSVTRTYLLLFSFDLNHHLAQNSFDYNDILVKEEEYKYEMNPFLYYNWTTFIGDYNLYHKKKKNIIPTVYHYSNDLNIRIAENIINSFTNTTFLKFLIFYETSYSPFKNRNIYNILNTFGLPYLDISSKHELVNKENISFSPFQVDFNFNPNDIAFYHYIGFFSNIAKYAVRVQSDNINSEGIITLLTMEEFNQLRHNAVNVFKKNMLSTNKLLTIQKKVKFYHTDIGNFLKEKDKIEYSRNKENESLYEYFYDKDLLKRKEIKYTGHYYLVQRNLKLNEFFDEVKKNTEHNKKYIELIMKNFKNSIQQNLQYVNYLDSCLFEINEEIPLSFIVQICNYNNLEYYNLRIKYEQNAIEYIKRYSDCKKLFFQHNRICKNLIVLRRLFSKNIDTVVSDIKSNELKRMNLKKEIIENNIDHNNIFSLSNDSLIAVVHHSLADVSNVTINVCFNMYKLMFSNKIIFKALYYSLKKTIFNIDHYNKNEMYKICTFVNIPIQLNKNILKSIHDIYLRAFMNVMHKEIFMKHFNNVLVYNLNIISKYFIYYFINFNYVYKINNFNYDDVTNKYVIPDNIKWNDFQKLKMYCLDTNYNNETFVGNFFTTHLDYNVYPIHNNIYNDFMSHVTAVFDLFYLYK